MTSFLPDFTTLNKKCAANKKYDELAIKVIEKYQVDFKTLVLLLESQKLSREVVGKVLLRCLSLKTQWTYVGQFTTAFEVAEKELARVGTSKDCCVVLVDHFLAEGNLLKAKAYATAARIEIPRAEMEKLFKRSLAREDYETARQVVEETNSFELLKALTRKLAAYGRELAQCPTLTPLPI